MKGNRRNQNQSLLQGPVFQSLLLFALPMAAGNLLQQSYNIADTWIVGRWIGPDALAAVGSAFALMTFLTSVQIGLCMGSSVVFSMAYGAQDEKRLKQSFCASAILVSAVSLVLCLLSYLACPFLGVWLNIPEEVSVLFSEYMWVVLAGIPAVGLYNFFASCQKARGDSVSPVLFLGVSVVLNIILDFWMIAGLGWQAAGAALATCISQWISGLGMMLYALYREPLLQKAFRQFSLSAESVQEVLTYSLLTCLQQSVMNLGILIVQGIVNRFGAVVMAAFAAANKIDAFAYMPAQEYGNAFSTFIAQNQGAGQTDRVKQGLKAALFTSVTYCLAASAVLWFLSESLITIFVDPSRQDIVQEGIRILHTIGPFYCCIGVLFLFYGYFRAVGRPVVSVVLTIFSLGTRIVLSLVLSAIPALGQEGIWWAVPAGWILADLAGFCFLALSRPEASAPPVQRSAL